MYKRLVAITPLHARLDHRTPAGMLPAPAPPMEKWLATRNSGMSAPIVWVLGRPYLRGG